MPEEAECPYEVEYIWDWFTELNAARPANGMCIGPIPYSEIAVWAKLMQLNLLPFEIKALRAIDEAYVTHCNTKDKKDG